MLDAESAAVEETLSKVPPLREHSSDNAMFYVGVGRASSLQRKGAAPRRAYLEGCLEQ